MAGEQIRLLVVEDVPQVASHVRSLLQAQSQIKMLDVVTAGDRAVGSVSEMRPDVVLVDALLQGRVSGQQVAQQIREAEPHVGVIMLTVPQNPVSENPQRGIDAVLKMPFTGFDLTTMVRKVGEERAVESARAGSLVVTLFSPKGGVGRTTVAVNLAIAAATELGKKVVIMDGSFQFGDVGVLLNLNPKSKSIADLIPELEAGELDSIDTFLINHTAGIRVLLAPPSPETAEMITASGVKKVLERLRADHDLVVVDCTSYFNDTTLAVLDAADVILTMLSLEITSIKNMRLFLEVAEQLGYEKGKVRLVLNRADSALGIRVADVEHSIGRKVDETVVSDGRSVVYALNRGVPFFLSNREAQVSQDILRLARSVVGGESQTATVEDRKSTQKKSLFAWR
jgi:pilus assembly protein CpaE